MRTLLTSLAMLALIFLIGCGGDDKAGYGSSPATTDDTTPPAKTIDTTPPTKTDGDAAKTLTYTCAACGKAEVLKTAAAAPS